MFLSLFIIHSILGNRENATHDDALAAEDFVAQLSSSYQFNVSSIDLAKLQMIRKEKNDKKKNHQLQQMGLFYETTKTISSKKIFLSKQARILNETVINNTGTRTYLIWFKNTVSSCSFSQSLTSS